METDFEKMAHVERRRLADDWMEAIKMTGRNLSSWETDFVDSLDTQMARPGFAPSPKQMLHIERIYAERTS